MQLPRKQILLDGDILKTNQERIFIKILAMEEDLIQIIANNDEGLIKVAYHLGNRHVDMEINKNHIFIKDDHVIENLLKNQKLKIIKLKKKFFPEIGAFKHG